MTSPLRVGVVGIGHLGSRHAQIYAAMPGIRLVAVCDIDADRARMLARQLGCRAVTDYRALLGEIDAASLAVPTTLHGAIGTPLLSRGIHLLIEKPIAATAAEADTLLRTAARHRCTLQVGHVERFNAAIRAAIGRLRHPRFIEVHRLSPYPRHSWPHSSRAARSGSSRARSRGRMDSGRAGGPSAVEARGTDVSVILDVMIHDLDLILALVRSRVTRVAALGVAVLSPSEDIANARVEFASGCVANLTASRISDETIRRIRVFQEDSYLSIDYKDQTVELACLRRGRGRQGQKRGLGIHRVHLPVNRRPPLQEELAAFVHAVRTQRTPLVTGEDGRAALSLALRIESIMRQRKS